MNAISQVEYDDKIIQVKLLNVEKNSLFVADIFQDISKNDVNIDMISEVMLDDEMRIDFTCSQSDQDKLNKALEDVKEDHPRIMVYQNRNVAKVKVQGEGMASEVGVAAHIFEILGKHQIPILQITTSEISISCVVPEDLMELAIKEIKEAYHL